MTQKSAPWYIVRDGQRYGPYSGENLRQFAASGHLLPVDLVQQEGKDQPVVASQIKGLFPVQAAPPPPPPPPAPAVDPSAPAAGKVDNSEPGFLTTILTQSFQLWPKLKTWEKVTAIVLLVVVLAVVVWVKVLQPASSGGWWEVLVDSGILTAVISGVFSLLSKFVGAKADQAAREGVIEMEGQFVGLDGGQWLFTLHVAFISVLVGAVVAGLLFGSVSLWVNGPALAVVGVLIAWLSRGVEQRIDERRTAFLESSDLPYWVRVSRAPAVPKEVVLSKYLGISTLPPALLALLCGCMGTSPRMLGVGGYAVWIYFAYGLLIGLPSIHVLQWVARHMNPIRRSAGVVISGGYLAAVFLSCIVISSMLTRAMAEYPVSEEVRAALVGTWEEDVAEPRPHERDERARIEFTRGGQAIITGWLGESTYDYQFRSPTKLILKTQYDGEVYGNVEILSADQLAVKHITQTKKFRKSGRKGAEGASKTQDKQSAPPEVAEALKTRLAGEWTKVNPTKRRGAEYTNQTVFFSKTGTIRYSGTMTLFTGRDTEESDSGKFEVIEENKIRVGDQTISFDFISDDEFVAQCFNRAGGRFQAVDGKFRRVKPMDSSKLKQQIVGRWEAMFPEGTVSYDFDGAGNATVGLPGQRPSKATYTISDNTIRMRHSANDNILTLTVVSISDNEATFKVQGANETVFRRKK